MDLSNCKFYESLSYPCFYMDRAFDLLYANQTALQLLPELCCPGELARRIHAAGSGLKQTLLAGQNATMLLYDLPTAYRSLFVLPLHDGFAATLCASPPIPEYPLNFSEQLRDPLTEIFATLPILSRHLDSKEGDAHLQRINRSCYQMLRASSMLSNLVRLALGTPQLRAVDFSALCATLCHTFTGIALPGTPPITCTVQGLPLIVNGDPELLACMLENLLSNALRFTRDGNHIAVTLTRFSERLLLRVQDFGAGIRPEVVPHIFETYYSAPVYPDGTQPGLGLGLPLVHLLAASMGGSVSVESVYGQGTLVAVALPLAQNSGTLPLASFVAGYVTNRYSSLFVELADFCQLPEI
ncbi:MAG: HAMP domain-containing sensor histidine kinase [Pygmaiobacter sp.]